jgi:hypothetical protein
MAEVEVQDHGPSTGESKPVDHDALSPMQAIIREAHLAHMVLYDSIPPDVKERSETERDALLLNLKERDDLPFEPIDLDKMKVNLNRVRNRRRNPVAKIRL